MINQLKQLPLKNHTRTETHIALIIFPDINIFFHVKRSHISVILISLTRSYDMHMLQFHVDSNGNSDQLVIRISTWLSSSPLMLDTVYKTSLSLYGKITKIWSGKDARMR